MTSPVGSSTKPPSCKYGYSEADMDAVVGPLGTPERLRFERWIWGQTIAVCNGKTYDYDRAVYVPSGCGPHGGVVYSSDVRRFLDGGQIVD